MTTDTLAMTVEATHRSLEGRFADAARALEGDRRAREAYARIDALMAATSRHLAAVEEVLVPEASRRLPDGAQVAQDYLVDARRLEQSMARLKARLYGEQHTADLSWADVWDHARRSLERHNRAERVLVDLLGSVLPPGRADEVAMSVYRAEVKAPTRAHPHIPHTGVAGVVSRRVFAVADRFWDAAQGRVVPPPVRPRSKHREHASLMSQFLTGEPTLDAQAPVFEHHAPRRRRARR